MKTVETSTTVEAPPERVWEVLADTGAWSDWDSGIVRVEGAPARGARIKITSEMNPKRAYPAPASRCARSSRARSCR